jgi:multiple sugar transport system substrate-binding protein
MNTRFLRLLSLLLLVGMVGCSSLPLNFEGGSRGTQIANGTTVTPTAALPFETGQPLTPSAPVGTAVTTLPAGAHLMRIWLPPEFDPQGTSQASQLLKTRLDDFVSENPDVRLEVRVKAEEGVGGLLDSLVAANVAAPLALPDLVMLPRPTLESAALKGLLYPYDGLTSIMDDTSWFEYARQMAHVQSSIYGIPFAGDALVLAYHPSLRQIPPPDLETALSLGEVLLFPATDPQASFTLSSYLAEGGSVQDAQGRPAMDMTKLTSILEIDQRASQSGVMPYWLTQYSTDAQVWDAFINNKYPTAITWASTYLSHRQAVPSDLAAAPMPTIDGTPYTLATGYSWALAGQDPERRALAVKLAEYLSDKGFQAEWTAAAGYLPPRMDALASFPDPTLKQVLDQISTSAQLMPPVDLVSSIGPALEQAVVDVLKAQSDPRTAAQTVMDQINKP